MRQVHLYSFGHMNGKLRDMDVIIDVRALADPANHNDLFMFTGRDRAIQKFVRRQPIAKALLETWTDRILNNEQLEHIGIGCMGGHHRSVAFAVELADILRDCGLAVTVTHVDLHTHSQQFGLEVK